jgi:hypothetical protein
VTRVDVGSAAARRHVAWLAALLVLAGCSSVTGPWRPASAIDLRGDFETADESQFSALECAAPERQVRVVTDPVRQGRYAARFEQAPGDQWVNGSVRCLAAAYDSGEGEGDDYFYAFSVYFPDEPADNLLWELHGPEEIYSVDPNTSVAPHTIAVDRGQLVYRLLTGPAVWDGDRWTGWSTYEPRIPLLDRIPVGEWIDLVVHIRFTHDDDGVLEVWHRTGEDAWPDGPQLQRRDVPTLQWIPGVDDRIWGHANDPAVPEDVRTSALYLELGLYKGGPTTLTTDVVYHDGFRRGPTLASVLEEFP